MKIKRRACHSPLSDILSGAFLLFYGLCRVEHRYRDLCQKQRRRGREQCGEPAPQTHGTCCSGRCLVELLCARQVRRKAWERLVKHYGSPEAVWGAAKKAFDK